MRRAMKVLGVLLLGGCPSAAGPAVPTTSAEVNGAKAGNGEYPLQTVPGSFVPPDARQRRAAIGSLSGLRGEQRRVFQEGDGLFEPVRVPNPGDWLDERVEVYQTFERYRARRKIHPSAERPAIYIVEIGEFSGDASPSVDHLSRYVEAYYAMPVERMPPISVEQIDVDAREHQGFIQLQAKQILDRLRERKPDGAFALAAVTMMDLYPDDEWNFVFGYADAKDQVGVFSFARFDPRAFGEPRPPQFSVYLLRRSVNTLAHELGHMFGISHCTHYHCVMNGHNHEAEGAAMPMHICPVDLRKLQLSIGFDPVARYRALQQVDRALGFAEEVQWLERRLAFIEGRR